MKKATDLRVILFAALAFLLAGSTALAQTGLYDWSGVPELGSYPGIKHAFVSASSPRSMNINALQIDTTTPNLKFFSTERSPNYVQNVEETRRKTTRTFISESQSTEIKVVAAVNAAPWSPWPPEPPDDWNTEGPANLSGLAVSDGILVSPGSGAPSLVVENDGTASMTSTPGGYDISNVHAAVSGFSFVLTNGNPIGGGGDLHPRTGIGVSQDGRYVYLMTIDGRQFFSDGATTGEVGTWLQHFGAYDGANMDGGGSTTMAWWNPDNTGSDKSELLNYPVGTGWGLRRERNVGSNLGVYYEAVTAIEGDYDTSSLVDQGDLDLVLLNWGDTSVPPGFDENAIPGGGPFDGQMDQNELDGVLLNWGDTLAVAAGTAVPEPSSTSMIIAVLAVMSLVRHSKRV